MNFSLASDNASAASAGSVVSNRFAYRHPWVIPWRRVPQVRTQVYTRALPFKGGRRSELKYSSGRRIM